MSERLFDAVKREDYDLINQLSYDENFDVNIKDKDGNTPLHHAMIQGNFSIAYVLYTCGADILLRNNKGKSALDIMIENEDDYGCGLIGEIWYEGMRDMLDRIAGHHHDSC